VNIGGVHSLNRIYYTVVFYSVKYYNMHTKKDAQCTLKYVVSQNALE